MNANELADWLDKFYANTENNMVNRAATMLRQQQAEIEALETEMKGTEMINFLYFIAGHALAVWLFCAGIYGVMK